MSELARAAVAAKTNPTMRDLVEQQLPAIERQLGGTMNSDAFVRAVLSEITKNPQLIPAAGAGKVKRRPAPEVAEAS